ncbi:Uncharacterised protein [Mycobacteroides abscessus subsp. abscessus]|nr:Uncharacterised protein [Mycobacteroides abscessus subsp. abscessus]
MGWSAANRADNAICAPKSRTPRVRISAISCSTIAISCVRSRCVSINRSSQALGPPSRWRGPGGSVRISRSSSSCDDNRSVVFTRCSESCPASAST